MKSRRDLQRDFVFHLDSYVDFNRAGGLGISPEAMNEHLRVHLLSPNVLYFGIPFFDFHAAQELGLDISSFPSRALTALVDYHQGNIENYLIPTRARPTKDQQKLCVTRVAAMLLAAHTINSVEIDFQTVNSICPTNVYEQELQKHKDTPFSRELAELLADLKKKDGKKSLSLTTLEQAEQHIYGQTRNIGRNYRKRLDTRS